MRKYVAAILFVGIVGLLGIVRYSIIPAANAQSGIDSAQAGEFVEKVISDEAASTQESDAAVTLGTTPAADAAAAKIEAALDRSVDIDLVAAPLNEVIDLLKAECKVEIQLDTKLLKETGKEPDVLVTKRLAGISLRVALRQLLGDFQMRYVIDDEVLLITSTIRAEGDEFQVAKIYPVKDLVLVRNEKGAIVADFAPLKDAITQSVAGKTWPENGGSGGIVDFQVGDHCLLFVSQTADVHEKLAAFLAALRKAGVAPGKATNKLLLPIQPTRPPQMPIMISTIPVVGSNVDVTRQTK
jgi:hypothetical protein